LKDGSAKHTTIVNRTIVNPTVVREIDASGECLTHPGVLPGKF
jgi:hypothetical protein